MVKLWPQTNAILGQAKPKPKPVAEKVIKDDSSNFVRKGGHEDREAREKVQRLEEKVS